MIGTDRLSETLAALFARAKGGVVGLVNELLPICLEHNVELELEADHGRVRSAEGNWEQLSGVTLPRPVFRAVLARVAVLCSEQGRTLSPYGGEGELLIGDDPRETLHIVFKNTPSVQKLALRRSQPDGANGKNGHE